MNSKIIQKFSPLIAILVLVSSACMCYAPSTIDIPISLGTPTPTGVPQQQMLLKQAPTCPMSWLKPGTAGFTGELPKTGETLFEWTEHPEAHGYQIIVTQPDGSQVPYNSDVPSKKLFMENYKQAGEYQVLLNALDGNGNTLCSITLTFSKAAVDPNHPNSSGNDGGGSNDTNPPVFIIIPTDVVPR
ncbi:MAG: hypothetical protein U0Z26_00975 [Anaerolineales bacterium]